MGGDSYPSVTLAVAGEFPSYLYSTTENAWSLVTINAPDSDDLPTQGDKRAPVDIVAVLDVSGSMSGAKLKLVKESIHFVMSQLLPQDRLAIVTFDTEVKRVVEFTSMTSGNKSLIATRLTSIRAGSCTNLSGGVVEGISIAKARRGTDASRSCSILLFTDGQANVGETETGAVCTRMMNAMKGQGLTQSSPQPPQPPQQQQRLSTSSGGLMGFLGFMGGRATANAAAPAVPLVYDANGVPQAPPPPPEYKAAWNDDSEQPDNVNQAITVSTFGFGSDHSASMLQGIAESGRGSYFYIESEATITSSFADALGGILTTVARGLRLSLNVSAGAKITKVQKRRF
jgi:hypothetical protein